MPKNMDVNVRAEEYATDEWERQSLEVWVKPEAAAFVRGVIALAWLSGGLYVHENTRGKP